MKINASKILAFLGIIIGAVTLILRLNIMALVCILFSAFMSVWIFIRALCKKLNIWDVLSYACPFGLLTLRNIIFGADAGFGAFTSGKAGFSSAEHTLLTGAGNFFTRLCGNLLLGLPVILCLLGIIIFIRKKSAKKILSSVLSVCLALMTVVYILTMNIRMKPVGKRMWEGHDEYLGGISKHGEDNPNVLVILTDDLGYGDVSANGAIYDTPNIDSVGENGINFENFYSSYSVCSPARFACLTGRYPYRSYADNVLYPTVSTFKPFAYTRLYNSFELGGNVDGMLGDEITIAEVFKAAGYDTGAFGKWHLGDYGEYLPTNQGFDYFYGSHYVNDMTPLYHVEESGGQYTIVHGTDELRDQSNATKWIYEELSSWLDETAKNDDPFFIYYATPWPHAPVFVGEEYDGATGMGTYVDCITEFDAYLGKLFDKLEAMGELDNTIIVFTSDNGPALQGSTGGLRGGKYLAYEGGQKVPFMLRWDKNGGLWKAGETRSESATLVDLFPTLIELAGIETGTENGLAADRQTDGISMLPLIKNDEVIHDKNTPILYMKREKLKSIQYSVPSADIKARPEYSGYTYPVLNNKNISFKYFQKIQNDNSAFFDKFRKNWLHILNDDVGENYNRTTVYPSVAAEMSEKMDEIMRGFKQNRRGIN